MHTPVFSGHLVCWVHFRRNGQGGNSTTWKRLYPVHCTCIMCVPSWWCAIYHKLMPTLEVIVMTSPLASLVCTIGASPLPRLQHILIQWIYMYLTYTCSSHRDIAIILSSLACSLDTPIGYTVYYFVYMYIHYWKFSCIHTGNWISNIFAQAH